MNNTSIVFCRSGVKSCLAAREATLCVVKDIEQKDADKVLGECDHLLCL